jgi:methionyl-tRNA formyltransferase
MSKLNLVFTGCKNTTLECMKAVLELNIKIDLLITISPELANKNKVAGFYDLCAFAKKNKIKTYICDSYTMKSEKDLINLKKNKINLLLVIGWQRLIPGWLLSNIKIGAFGMHGSSRALPYGRGRSPMNWSLIQNRKMFITNLFKYNEDIDAGEIVDSVVFDINMFDTAQTLHYKNTMSMIKILKDNIKDMMKNKLSLTPQLNVQPSYYPKRTAEDGIIFWDRDTVEIYNLIRAVTIPFHGAFTFYKKKKILIWKAYPFDTRLFDASITPGTILETFLKGDFIVKTGSDSMIVTDYVAEDNLKIIKNMQFNSANYIFKSPYMYPIYESKL